MAREEHMWRQRAQVQWLTEGDKNTRYFHVKASQRRQRNETRGIYNIAGQWMENQHDIKQIAVSYFDNLSLHQSQAKFKMEPELFYQR